MKWIKASGVIGNRKKKDFSSLKEKFFAEL
jgi:hypothetical protein